MDNNFDAVFATEKKRREQKNVKLFILLTKYNEVMF